MGEKRIRVLLVDDSVAFRSALRAAIGVEPGIELVAEAADGRAAIEAAARHRPDVVMMDISMPVMNGLTATRIIRAAHPDMKVIVLSVSDEGVYRTLALDAGANAFLSKTSSSSAVTSEILRVHQDA